MRRRRWLLLLAATVALSGCSTVDGLVERVRPVERTGTPVVTLAVMAPMSGGQTRAGLAVVDAVEQAVADSGGVEGWDIAVDVIDTTSPGLPDDIDALGDNDSAVAVVGGLSPQSIRSLVPLLEDDGLTVVSPADTDPRHTRGADPSAPLRPWSVYSTVAVEPTPEATALADHLARAIGIGRALVVHGKNAESRERAADVMDALKERGIADVVAAEATASVEADVATLGAGDALVVDGGVGRTRALVESARDDVAVALTTVPAALDEPTAAALEGAIAPQMGLDHRRGSDELSRRYSDSGRDATLGQYGPAAYDAARVLVDALTRCLPDPQRSTSPSRSACRAEVAGTVWDGITGPIQLDEYGARLGLLPPVVALRDGEWT
jgi:branched-chain amino acid transport system substrate-binding protein